MVDPDNSRLLSREEFALQMKIDDALLERFDTYRVLLEKWQKRINLVSRSTLPDFWRRHFLDSAQLYPLIPQTARTLVDLGSGAGFPGLVLALLARERGGPEIHLVEADSRKAAFLSEANRILETGVTVHARRIESITELKADVITARALSPLDRLLDQAERFMTKETACLFLKGENVSDELTIAGKHWTMNVTETASLTHDLARILNLTEVSRVD
jgi:16S rRNA (guanine527-N7)-methyltransferase